MSNFDEIFEKITNFLKTEANTDTIIGKQFTLGEFTCVPVMSVGMGMGGGQGEGKDKNNQQGTGAGGGAGFGLRPIGFLVTRGSEIQFVGARTGSGLGTAFEKLPELLEKYLSKKQEKEKV